MPVPPSRVPPITDVSVILLVEDNEDDVFLTKHALKEAGIGNPIHVVETGPDAIDYLAGEGRFSDRARHPLPGLVFLDLKLPMISGHEVLGWIRGQRHLDSMVVVVLTSSDEPSDVRRSYSLGANSYLVKPLSARQLLDLGRAFNWSWARCVQAAGSPAAE